MCPRCLGVGNVSLRVMYIRQIKLKNFKSFRDEEVVVLSRGVNVVVGRNGSGKSNIMCAVRFVVCGERHGWESRTEVLHEGSRASEEEASVEVLFGSDASGGVAETQLAVRRTVSAKKDEYALDGKAASRDEVMGALRSNGFVVDSPYFIVQQEKVSELAVAGDEKRYEVMKDVAGVSSYDRDRESSVCVLKETEQSESKIEHLLERVSEKLRGLEGEKREAELRESLEKEKRRLEYGYVEREVGEINEEICRIEGLISNGFEESSEGCEDHVCEVKEIEARIASLVSRRKELVIDERYRDKEADVMREMRAAEKRKDELYKSLEDEKRQLAMLRREAGENFVRSSYVKYLGGFLETVGSREVRDEEVEAAREVLLQKTEELRKSGEGERDEAARVKGRKDLESLVEKRKHLWREERRMETSSKSIEEMARSQEDRLIVMGSMGPEVYRQIRGSEGVIGYVYDLVGVPAELVDAFEAVVGSSLFNIVVEDEGVASRLLCQMKDLKFRVTFMPLSRIKVGESEEVRDPGVILLTSQLRCDARYKTLLRYVTRDSYLCSDLKQAVDLSRKYGINVVTVSGDIVSRDGSMSGGYERRSGAFRDYKKISREARKTRGELDRIRSEIRKVSKEIEEARVYRESECGESRYHESLRATVLFLQEKVRMLSEIARGGAERSEALSKAKGRARKAREEERDLKLKRALILGEIRRLEAKVSESSGEIKKLSDRISCLSEEAEKCKMCREVARIDRKIEELRSRGRAAKEMMFDEENMDVFARPRRIDVEMEKLVSRKHMLMSKRSELCSRIGVSDFRGLERLYPEKEKEEIMKEIGRINERIRTFSLVNRKAVSQWEEYGGQRDAMRAKLEDLRCDRQRIVDFMASLDVKKDGEMRSAVSAVMEGFSEFYSRLTGGGAAELCVREGGIGIMADGEEIDTNLLSGGQKAVMALCLIFSMQRVSPSPLYIFDEIDANLDERSRERVAMVIREMNESCASQFVIATFRKEMVVCGDKHFRVEFKEKRSRVTEVEMAVAHRLLDEDAAER